MQSTSVTLPRVLPCFGSSLIVLRREFRTSVVAKMGMVYKKRDVADLVIASLAQTFDIPSDSSLFWGLLTEIPVLSSPLLTKEMFSALEVATAPQFAT
jgi:hypothetical protein